MVTLNEVREFWNRASCGEVYAVGDDLKSQYLRVSDLRYELEPYILPFADFSAAYGKDALEIGVGMGSDHHQLALAQPKTLRGIDLTERALAHTRARFELFGLSSILEVGDAEALRFEDESFDYIYSYGVIHHSPNTQQAVREIYRVLRKGGVAKIMIYHKYSIVGYLLWIKYALLKGRPSLSLATMYADYLESPGTKAYSVAEAKEMFAMFSEARVSAQLAFGDLLLGAVGQRHTSPGLAIAKRIWPRALIKALSARFNFGLCLMIEATK